MQFRLEPEDSGNFTKSLQWVDVGLYASSAKAGRTAGASPVRLVVKNEGYGNLDSCQTIKQPCLLRP